MKFPPRFLTALMCALGCFAIYAGADEPAAPPQNLPRAGPIKPPPIELGPDDHRAFDDAPDGFDRRRPGIAHGKVEAVEYDSRSIGTRRKLRIYIPPGYSRDHRYPVLYLLHGIGGDETEWLRSVDADVILDNLLAARAIEPMIVVFPNGRAIRNDHADGDYFSPDKIAGFAAFEADLFGDVIPYVDAHYSTLTDRDHRALAGLSMGGGQSLNFGLTHLELFSWIGGFSSAPNTKPPELLVPDPAAAAKLRLLWLSCGRKDGLIFISQRTHAYLKTKGVPHVWNVDAHAHDPAEWENNLYLFAQRIFR